MSALYDTNAAVLETAAFISIGGGPLPYLVGYRQNDTLIKGCNMISPSFVAVADGKAKLSDWRPTNADAYTMGEISFETLDEFGRSTPNTTFCWVDPNYSMDPTKCCWCDGSWIPAEKEFVAGEAIWLTMPGDNAGVSPVGLLDAGAVNAEDITMTLRKGCNSVGNFMAVAYPIVDIEILNNTSFSMGEISFESLDEFGRSVPNTTFCWVDPNYSMDPSKCCWCDGSWLPIDDTNVLEPGQAVWFTSPMESENEGDGLQIKFYAPDL